MISCTDFILAYSELFKYIEEKSGRGAVDEFWTHLFKPTGEGIPLINYVEKEGIRGCFTYWSGSLNEEAADFSMYVNEKAGWFMLKMHRCPSKGRLLELREETGTEPFHDYCLHCDHYRSAVEKAGLKYMYNFVGTDNASCSIIIYDPEIFDGKLICDENTVVMERKASDNEYFHQGFHNSLNMGIDYIGEKYGKEGVCEYLRKYTSVAYGKRIEDIKKNGFKELQDVILDIYTKEKATDAVEFSQEGNILRLKVKYCPAVKYLSGDGKKVSEWFSYISKTVFQTIAESAGCSFECKLYDEATGRAEYSFEIR